MEGETNMREWFRRFAHRVSELVGAPASFIIGLAVILVWAFTGPVFLYSDTWQLVINTGTTIVTFLMVFLIQNTQNRDARAMHLKLDELIRAVQPARNEMVDAENLSDEELDRLQKQFAELRQHADRKLQRIEENRKRRLAAASHSTKADGAKKGK
jgi:low affinity Fe/Cu permease